MNQHCFQSRRLILLRRYSYQENYSKARTVNNILVENGVKYRTEHKKNETQSLSSFLFFHGQSNDRLIGLILLNSHTITIS